MSITNENRNFNKEPLNARAVRVLQSWFQACGVYAEPHPAPGYGLVVKIAGSNNLANVRVTPSEPITTEPGSLNVSASGTNLLSVDRKVAVGEFNFVAASLGYSELVPVDRGERPDHRLNVDDDFDLIVMRHMEFRNAPNPDPELFKRYEKAITNPSIFFYRHNTFLCDLYGLTVEDLTSYAMVWATNFLHKYQRTDRGFTENAKLLNAHVMQRFINFHGALSRRIANVFPDEQTSCIGCRGDIVPTHTGKDNRYASSTYFFKEDGSRDLVDVSYDQSSLDEDGDEPITRRKPEIDTSSIKKRRASAAALLAKKLSELPHDEMVCRLHEVADSDKFDPVAREEATKRIKDHESGCSDCKASEVGNGLMK